MSGGLESIAGAQDDMLIPGLNFKLPQGASYVSQRRFSTFFPQGSNIYSTTGTRLTRPRASSESSDSAPASASLASASDSGSEGGGA